jgi:hypothetical protein
MHSLFNDAARSSGKYMPYYYVIGGMINEYWIGKVMEGSGFHVV